MFSGLVHIAEMGYTRYKNKNPSKKVMAVAIKKLSIKRAKILEKNIMSFAMASKLSVTSLDVVREK